MPEAQALFSEVAPTDGGSPPKIATWRAGFIPRPAATQLPMKTSSIRSTGTPVRATRALTQVAPSWGAGTAASPPIMAPIGVRTPATIIVSVFAIVMVLDLAEPFRNCDPSWAPPAARTGQQIAHMERRLNQLAAE